MQNMETIFTALILATLCYVGGYGLYTVIRLRRERTLFKNRFIYPANCSPESCLDEAGFIAYITPRILIVALASLLLGIALGVIHFLLPANVLPWWVESLVIPISGALLLGWFMYVQNRAYKLFW